MAEKCLGSEYSHNKQTRNKTTDFRVSLVVNLWKTTISKLFMVKCAALKLEFHILEIH